jgi:hypothetical protein
VNCETANRADRLPERSSKNLVSPFFFQRPLANAGGRFQFMPASRESMGNMDLPFQLLDGDPHPEFLSPEFIARHQYRIINVHHSFVRARAVKWHLQDRILNCGAKTVVQNPDANKRTQLGAAAWIIEANCQRALNPVPYSFAACEADSNKRSQFSFRPHCFTEVVARRIGVFWSSY